MINTEKLQETKQLIKKMKQTGIILILIYCFPGCQNKSQPDKMNVKVSSALDSLSPINMTDENIRTCWAAKSGNSGEYAILDLEKSFDVYSIQINFTEYNTEIFGRQNNLLHRYTIEYSNNAKKWTLLIDKSKNETDNSHDYIQLPNKVSCRYLKITNIEVPGGNFAISGFRVFGKGYGDAPKRSVSLWQREIPMTEEA